MKYRGQLHHHDDNVGARGDSDGGGRGVSDPVGNPAAKTAAIRLWLWELLPVLPDGQRQQL